MHQAQAGILELLKEEKWADAFARFEKLPEVERSPLVLLWGSAAAFELGRNETAQELVEAGIRAWRPGTDPIRELGQLRFQRARVALRQGEFATAESEFKTFLFSTLPGGAYSELAVARWKAYFYLGLLYRQVCRFDEAVGAYQTALDLLRDQGNQDMACATLQNLAWVYCMAGRPELARESLLEASTYAQSPCAIHHQHIGESFLAFVEGKVLEAMLVCNSLLEGKQPLSYEVRSAVEWLKGQCLLAIGEQTSAQEYADNALLFAVQSSDQRLTADAQQLQLAVKQAGEY